MAKRKRDLETLAAEPEEVEEPEESAETEVEDEDEADHEVEVKRGAILDIGDLKKVKVDGLRGGYGAAFFNDDCVTDKPISPDMIENLRSRFGDSAVEVLE